MAEGGGESQEQAQADCKSILPSQDTQTRLVCAEKFGQAHSLAAGLGFFFGDKVENNFATQLFLGNSVSSLFKIGTDISGGTTPTGSQLASTVLKGGAQGIPTRGLPGMSGVTGQARNAVVGPIAATVVNGITGTGQQTLELGLTSTVLETAAPVAADTAAFAFTAGKFALDAFTFTVGLVKGCPQ